MPVRVVAVPLTVKLRVSLCISPALGALRSAKASSIAKRATTWWSSCLTLTGASGEAVAESPMSWIDLRSIPLTSAPVMKKATVPSAWVKLVFQTSGAMRSCRLPPPPPGPPGPTMRTVAVSCVLLPLTVKLSVSVWVSPGLGLASRAKAPAFVNRATVWWSSWWVEAGASAAAVAESPLSMIEPRSTSAAPEPVTKASTNPCDCG